MINNVRLPVLRQSIFPCPPNPSTTPTTQNITLVRSTHRERDILTYQPRRRTRTPEHGPVCFREQARPRRLRARHRRLVAPVARSDGRSGHDLERDTRAWPVARGRVLVGHERNDEVPVRCRNDLWCAGWWHSVSAGSWLSARGEPV